MRQALTSTMKVISDDLRINDKKNINTNNNQSKLLAIDNLSSLRDFVRLRAEFDSSALKKKFSNKEIFKNNLPKNPSCESLYKLAEKTRYELLGSQMLKGVKKNLNQNYYQIIDAKRDQRPYQEKRSKGE